MATTKTKETASVKTSSADKRARQGALRHARNTSVITRLKTQEKKVRLAIEGGTDEVKAMYEKFVSALDKAAKQGVIHKNAAARKKSSFNKRVAAGPTTLTKAAAKPKAIKAKGKTTSSSK